VRRIGFSWNTIENMILKWKQVFQVINIDTIFATV